MIISVQCRFNGSLEMMWIGMVHGIGGKVIPVPGSLHKKKNEGAQWFRQAEGTEIFCDVIGKIDGALE